ncbi:hypothetical protein BOX15_Mlig000381g4 [Macrostomum lignano]|uniref:BTB domain-containing protein n=1 Tax=Macrostomum lignano TaxID=282301 RepID=A0A267EAL3_9PLAT|nr:hypothetical protein BOX15_Mlig000381g4 [Macrostomum lignano]
MRSEYRQAGPERLSELFDHLLAELAGLDNRQRPSGGGASGGFRVSARWEKRAKKAARRAGLAVRLLRSVRGEPAAAEFWRRLAACLPRGCHEALGLLRELALLPPDFAAPDAADSAAVAASDMDAAAASVSAVSLEEAEDASGASASATATAAAAVMPSELQLCLTRLWRGELSQPAPDLLVTTCDERSFRVHSLVLAGRCPWIRRVLQSGMCEALERHLRLPDCEGPLVERLLEFLYTGVLPVGRTPPRTGWWTCCCWPTGSSWSACRRSAPAPWWPGSASRPPCRCWRWASGPARQR